MVTLCSSIHVFVHGHTMLICTCVCPDQMDSTAAAATTAAAEVAEEATETVSEDVVEYGPQLPENYIPPSDEQPVTDVSSRKRPTTDDDNVQDIDNMLDDALEVKRPRLDEGRWNDGLLFSLLQLEC